MAYAIPHFAALARYKVEISWLKVPAGLFVIGFSQLGSSDQLGASSWDTTFAGAYDDVTDDVDEDAFESVRGRTDDFEAMGAGTITVNLKDPDSKYNRNNPASPLYGYLNPRRPIRITATLDSRAAVLSDAPWTFWRLGETSGTTAADACGNLPLTHGAGVTVNQTGLLTNDTNKAATYAASSTATSTGSPSGGLAALFAGASWSVDAWVTGSGLDANDRVILACRASNGSGVIISATSTRLRVQRRDSAAGVDNCDYTITIGATPVHIMATYDGANIRVYTNGVLRTTQPSTRTVTTPTTFALGNDSNTAASTTAWVGKLDEVATYGTVLSADTALAHYDAGVGTRFPIFYGFTRRIEQKPDGRGGRAVITAVDMYQRLQRIKPTISATGPTTVGAAFGLMLDDAEWIDPTMRSLAVGDTIPNFAANGDKDILTIGEELLEVDRGSFFQRADGVMAYLDRFDRWERPAVATIAKTMRAIASGADLDRIINKQKAAVTGSTPQEASDVESAHDYGEAEGDLIESSYLTSDSKALNLAQYIVISRKDPGSDLWTLELSNSDSATLRQMLLRELIDRVAVTQAETGTTGDYHIEQVTHNVALGGKRHNTVWRLSERRTSNLFLLGTSQLGSTDALGY